jgi:hypothetical protein
LNVETETLNFDDLLETHMHFRFLATKIWAEIWRADSSDEKSASKISRTYVTEKLNPLRKKSEKNMPFTFLNFYELKERMRRL